MNRPGQRRRAPAKRALLPRWMALILTPVVLLLGHVAVPQGNSRCSQPVTDGLMGRQGRSICSDSSPSGQVQHSSFGVFVCILSAFVTPLRWSEPKIIW
jgi:hypothetical protein